MSKIKSIFSSPHKQTLESRARKLDDQELFTALENSVASMNGYLGAYRQERDEYILGELKILAESVFVFSEVLESRKTNVEAIGGKTRQLKERKPRVTQRSY